MNTWFLVVLLQFSCFGDAYERNHDRCAPFISEVSGARASSQPNSDFFVELGLKENCIIKTNKLSQYLLLGLQSGGIHDYKPYVSMYADLQRISWENKTNVLKRPSENVQHTENKKIKLDAAFDKKLNKTEKKGRPPGSQTQLSSSTPLFATLGRGSTCQSASNCYDISMENGYINSLQEDPDLNYNITVVFVLVKVDMQKREKLKKLCSYKYVTDGKRSKNVEGINFINRETMTMIANLLTDAVVFSQSSDFQMDGFLQLFEVNQIEPCAILLSPIDDSESYSRCFSVARHHHHLSKSSLHSYSPFWSPSKKTPSMTNDCSRSFLTRMDTKTTFGSQSFNAMHKENWEIGRSYFHNEFRQPISEFSPVTPNDQIRTEAFLTLQNLVIPIASTSYTSIECGRREMMDAILLDRFIALLVQENCSGSCLFVPSGVINPIKEDSFNVYSSSGGIYTWTEKTKLGIIGMICPANHFQIGLMERTDEGRFEIYTYDSTVPKTIIDTLTSEPEIKIENRFVCSEVFKKNVAVIFTNVEREKIDVYHGKACQQRDTTSCGILVAMSVANRVRKMNNSSGNILDVPVYEDCYEWTLTEYEAALNRTQNYMAKLIDMHETNTVHLYTGLLPERSSTGVYDDDLFFISPPDNDGHYSEFDLDKNDAISQYEDKLRAVNRYSHFFSHEQFVDKMEKLTIEIRKLERRLSENEQNENKKNSISNEFEAEISNRVQKSAGVKTEKIGSYKSELISKLQKSGLFSEGSGAPERIANRHFSWLQLFHVSGDVVARCSICTNSFPPPLDGSCETPTPSATGAVPGNQETRSDQEGNTKDRKKLTKIAAAEVQRASYIAKTRHSLTTPQIAMSDTTRSYKGLERRDGVCLKEVYGQQLVAKNRERAIENRFGYHEETTSHITAISEINKKIKETISNTISWSPFDSLSSTKSLMRITVNHLQNNGKFSQFEETALVSISNGGLPATTHLTEYAVRKMAHIIYEYSSSIVCNYLIENKMPFSIMTDGSTDSANRGINVFLLRTVVRNRPMVFHVGTVQVTSHTASKTYDSLINAVNMFSKDSSADFWKMFRDNLISISTDGANSVSSKNEGLFGYVIRHVQQQQIEDNVKIRSPIQSVCFTHSLETVTKKLMGSPQHALSISIIQVLHNLLSTETSLLAHTTYHSIGNSKNLTTLRMTRFCDVRWSGFTETSLERILRSYQGILETMNTIVGNDKPYSALVQKKARIILFLLRDHRVFLALHNTYRVASMFANIEKKLQSDNALISENIQIMEELRSDIENFADQTYVAIEKRSFGLKCSVMGRRTKCTSMMLLNTFMNIDSDNIEMEKHASFSLDPTVENPKYRRNDEALVKFRDLDLANLLKDLNKLYEGNNAHSEFTTLDNSRLWKERLRTDSNEIKKRLDSIIDEANDSILNNFIELYVICFGLEKPIRFGEIVKSTSNFLNDAVKKKFADHRDDVTIAGSSVQIHNFGCVRKELLVDSIVCPKVSVFIDCGSYNPVEVIKSASSLENHFPSVLENDLISNHIVIFYQQDFPNAFEFYINAMKSSIIESRFFEIILDAETKKLNHESIQAMESIELMELYQEVIAYSISNAETTPKYFSQMLLFLKSIMVISPSTAPVERSFSIINHFLDHSNSQMSMETLNSRLSAKYNLPPSYLMNMNDLAAAWISASHNSVTISKKGTAAAAVDAIRQGAPISFNLLKQVTKNDKKKALHLDSILDIYT